jgi:hypothetical protein
MPTLKRARRQDRDRKMIAASRKYLSNRTAILIAGVSYTPAEFIAAIEHDAAIDDAATKAKTAFLAAAAAANGQHAATRSFFAGVKTYVQNQFSDPNTIAEFGLTSPRVKESDAATKALAVDKRRATRKARHTLGKKPKARIKGDVTGAVVTPVTAIPAEE